VLLLYLLSQLVAVAAVPVQVVDSAIEIINLSLPVTPIR